MPSATTRRLKAAAIFCAVGLAAIAGFQAFGAYRMAGQPTVIVTVNLSQVMEKLDQRADMSARLNQVRTKMQAEQEKQTAEHQRMQEEGKQLEKDLADATDPQTRKSIETRLQQLQEDLAMALLNYQAWASFSAEKFDIESALAMQDLYRSVKTAAAQMAATNGYDIVLVDDSQGELATTGDSRVPRVDQIRQQISSRRMLHVKPTTDITDELIQRMNNARKTPGPRSP